MTRELVVGLGILLSLACINYTLNRRHKIIMTVLSNVQAAETDLIAKTDALLAFATATQALVAQLQAQIAAGGLDPATTQALQSVADALTAESAKVAAFLPPVPAPVA